MKEGTAMMNKCSYVISAGCKVDKKECPKDGIKVPNL
jgi:hypothetical protein